jgi:hypothetical protein
MSARIGVIVGVENSFLTLLIKVEIYKGVFFTTKL